MAEERRLVAILFADVTGSTALGEDLDPEDARALMARYYQHASKIMPHFGGKLEKFIGDAVVAVFGIPRALGDDGERALASALALRDAVAADEILGPVFQLRIGVNMGEVVATGGGATDQFIASGDAMNTASRLQSTAHPGEILASERTVHATEDAFAFDHERVVELKGKRDPQRVFPLIGARARKRMERPPLVGRRHDLNQLLLIASRAVEEGRPALTSLIGPAGIGKTRLAEEFMARLEPADGFRTVSVSFSPYGQTTTSEPLMQLLAGMLGEEVTPAGVEQALSRGGYSAEHCASIAATILASVGLDGVAEAADDWESVIAAWRLLVELLAAEAPHVIAFDNLHLCGDELISLVERLATPRARVPLVILVLARPELLDRRPTWGGGRPNATALSIQALAPNHIDALVTRYLPDAAQKRRETIVERAGGNPFFALELVRSASDPANGGHQLPDTVHAAVLARLDLLAGSSRTVLRTVSVGGSALPVALLRDLLRELRPEELDPAVDDLLTRDFLVSSGRGLAFRHALVQDVTYSSLSRSERIRIHSDIAQLLTQVGGADDELVPVIAHHYRRSITLSRQSAVGLQLPFEPARAIEVLERASARASHIGAFGDAQVALESAIQVAPADQRARLEELLGDSIGWSVPAVRAYQSALEHRTSATPSDPEAEAEAGVRLRRKLLILLTRGALADRMALAPSVPREYYLEARRLAEGLSDEYERWRLNVVDLFLKEGGAYPELLAMGEQAATYFAGIGDWPACSEALDGCQSVATATGHLEQALDACRRRAAIGDLPAREFGDALSMLSMAYWRAGDPASSLQVVETVLHDVRPGQPIVHLAHAIGQAESTAYYAGDWSAAARLREWLEEAYAQSLSSPQDTAYCADGFFSLLSIAVAREDRTEAVRLSEVYLQSFSAMEHLLPMVRELLDTELADDPDRCRLTAAELGAQAHSVVAFRNERGLISSPELVAAAARNGLARTLLTTDVARALASADMARLSDLVDELEHLGQVVPAARMRIVLAARLRDRSQLNRAVAVLARLEDRRFLRRAAAVDAELPAT